MMGFMASDTMQAWVLDRYGSPDDLVLREVPRPPPGAGEIMVRVVAASVNDWDWCIVRGVPAYVRAFTGWRRPRVAVLGVDAAGVVEAVGADVNSIEPGDRVHGDLSASGFGAFGEFVCGPKSVWRRMPDGMGFEEAAALPHAGGLAWQGLEQLGGLTPEDSLLVNGAGGGVGMLAAHIARSFGVRSLTGVDALSKHEAMRAAGYETVIDYRSDDFTRTGVRYTCVLDTRSDRPLTSYARALEPEGRYVTVGGTTGALLRVGLLGPAFGRLLRKRYHLLSLKPNEGLVEVNTMWKARLLAPSVDRVSPYADLPTAIARFGRGEHIGKIVVRVGSGPR